MDNSNASRRRKFGNNTGLSLVETAMAMGFFAVVIAVAGKILAGFSGAMQSQAQRHEAIEHCRAVIARMRMDRDNSALPFPQQVTAQWPDGAQTNDPAIVTLADEVLTVNYANPAADPLRVTVTAQWTDQAGRPRRATLSTLLTGTNR